MLASSDPGPTEELCKRPYHQIKQNYSQPTQRPTPLPSRIGIRRHFFWCAFTNQLFNFSQRGCISEGSFIDLNLIAILNCAQQLDTGERIKLQVCSQSRRSIESSGCFTTESSDDFS